MKKIINCILLSVIVFTISFFTNVDVTANENIFHNNMSKNRGAFAILTDCQRGEKYLCNVTVNKIKKFNNEDDDIYEVESEVQVAIPKEGSEKAVLLANSTTQEEYDGSLSWKAYIKTTYKRNGNKYLVTKTNGNWKCSDASVKISDRRVWSYVKI